MENASRSPSPSFIKSTTPFLGQAGALQAPRYEQPNWLTASEKPHFSWLTSRISKDTLRLAALLIFTSLASILGVLLLQSTSDQIHPDAWIAYPVGGSHGPLFQLRIVESNTSKWVATHAENFQDSFAFRIDDQTLIPKELLSSQEIRYQDWFRKFYPQLWDVYSGGQYLAGDYLTAASSNMIHIDLRFHLSHCVLALRRYWDAKETGKHVCPRDLDPGHIGHCLNALDEWAFPEDGVSPKHNVWLEWVTQVCEYDV